MSTNNRLAALVVSGALTFGAAGAAWAAALEAEYLFNNTLAASGGGVPALVAVDPLGANTFETQTVFGSSRVVYHTDGNASPVTQQAGLSLDTTGLVTGNDYSVEMVFEFFGTIGWRRIVDVEGRQSDDGFYVDPNSHLDVFPVPGAAGPTTFTADVFHSVVLTDSGGTVAAYLDGNLEFSVSSAVMNINNVNNAGNLMNFYLDNVVGGGQNEFSDADTALIRLYDGALTGTEVAALARDPFGNGGGGGGGLPEPATLALLGLGLAGLAAARRRKR